MSYAATSRAYAFGRGRDRSAFLRSMLAAFAAEQGRGHGCGHREHHGHRSSFESRSWPPERADRAWSPERPDQSDRERGRWGMRPPGSSGKSFGGHPFGGHPFGGPFGGPPWARHGGGFPMPPWRSGFKARRGDVRAAILSVLADGPRNGYQIIGEIASRTDDAWRPSPGSIYPTLSQLEDEGLVRATEDGGKRMFELTDAGHAYVTEHPDEMAELWEPHAEPEPDEWRGSFDAFKQVAAATWQVMQTGTSAQRAEARTILADARRALYRILGEGVDPADDIASGHSDDSPADGQTDAGDET